MKYPLLTKAIAMVGPLAGLYMIVQGAIYDHVLFANLAFFLLWLGFVGSILGLFVEHKRDELPQWIQTYRLAVGIVAIWVLAAGGWFATAVALILTWVFREASKDGPVASIKANIKT